MRPLLFIICLTIAEAETGTQSVIGQAKALAEHGHAAAALHLLDSIQANDLPVEYFVLRGTLEAQSGLYAKADTDLRTAVSRRPNLPSVLYTIGLLRLELGKYAEARDALRRSVTVSPDNPRSWLALGEAYANLKNRAELDRCLQKALELGGNSATINYGAATIYQKTGQLAQAAEYFQQAADLDPTNKTAMALFVRSLLVSGQIEKARAAAQTWRDAHPNFVPQNVEIGTVFGEMQFYPDAIEQFQQVLRINPSLTEAKYNLALAYLFNGDYDAAADLAQDLKTQQDGSAENLLGLIKEEQGDILAARAAFQASLAATPHSAATLYHLGRIALELTDFAGAQRDFQASAGFCAGNCIEPLLGIATAYKLQGKFDDAASTIESVIRREPNDVIGYLYLGDTFIRAHNYIKASEVLRKAVTVNAGSGLAHYMYAYALLKQSPDVVPEAAIPSLRTAIRLDPKSGLSYLRLGTIYLQHGDYARAKPLLETAAALEPNMKDAHFQFATVLKKLGESQLAEKEFEKFRLLTNERIQEDVSMMGELRRISPN